MIESIKAYLRVPFSMIVWVMETYAANRERLARFMARPLVARIFKGAVLITFLAWLGIAFLIADDEAGGRLEDAVRTYVPQAVDWGLMDEAGAPEDGAKPTGGTSGTE
ncbi:hypothetical protein KAJ83_00655 [Marivibrio halodurans]|uniref:Uncharacterized protein n=1 Tax=Marivibrio halodurans TaxID=2039722 RepID=A0A8J7SG47_9PROT|nr:hypothetical protein [Marivibrio halodurans]MBP5855503.1 hypothetical protein [Marivibrio halodurans]